MARSTVFLLLLILCGVFAAEEPSTLKLDPKTRQLALSLLRDFSNRTRLAELIANGSTDQSVVTNTLSRFPAKPVAEIYRNYTLHQIAGLERELAQHEHFIYTPIEEKTREIESDFGSACKTYDQTGDLEAFEGKFLETGKEIVSLQKMVLRIINSKLEDKLKSPPKGTHYRSARNWVYDAFNRLNGLFLGTQNEIVYHSADTSQVNKVYSLMKALEGIENAQPTDEATRKTVDRLKTLLYRLRKVYALNRIASVPNVYLSTENISPFNYEAMLRLVTLLGAQNGAQGGTQQFNPLMTLFRSWMNFFNGGNLFAALMSPGAGSGTGTGSGPVQDPARRPAKYDANRLRQMIRILEENERLRQAQIEANRQKLALENMLKNQNKQQQQIEEILKLLVGKQPSTGNNNNNSNANNNNGFPTRQPWAPPANPQLPPQWPSVAPGWPTRTPPASSTNPNSGAEFLQKLKEQRRHLKDLLEELQKPIASQPGAGAGSGLWPNRWPVTSVPSSPSSGANPPVGVMPSNTDIQAAQQALMGIMKNITPLLSAMGQSGMVSAPRLERSKFQLLDILNAVNNREGEETSEGEDKSKEMERVEKLGVKLETVLDSIIDEAEKKVPVSL